MNRDPQRDPRIMPPMPEAERDGAESPPVPGGGFAPLPERPPNRPVPLPPGAGPYRVEIVG